LNSTLRHFQERRSTLQYENVPAEEQQQIQNIVDLTRQQMMKRYPSPDKIRRGVHPKDHGCVLASFKIDEDLDESLRVGVFSDPGAEYPCAIRFSNAATLIGPDSTVGPDGKPMHGSRGMAIKLVGLDSPSAEGFIPVQDFLMINQPVFAFANVEDYEVLSKVILETHNHSTMTEDPRPFFKIQTEKGGAAAERAKRTGELVGRIRASSVAEGAFQDPPAHPAQNSYFSAAPFLFGEGRVVKFRVVPISEPVTSSPEFVEPDYLRKALKLRLDPARPGNNPIVFRFGVQVRKIEEVDIDSEIENACTEWSEQITPFQDVATIAILPQDFDSNAAKTRCENIFLTPWHTHPDHRPLGGINRLRQSVYEASMKMRLGK
jgi:hypothetical protein